MFQKKRWLFLLMGLFLTVVLVLVACQQEEPETVEVTRIVEIEVPVEVAGAEVEVTRVVEIQVPVTTTVELEAQAVPFEEQWRNSPHADASAAAFNRWNEDDPAEIPVTCAKCHSTPGYIDFLGGDGSAVNVVDAPAPLGTTVECAACHNEAAVNLTSAVFPSGVEVTGLGDEARCIQCHQGRTSSVQVNDRIAEAGLGEGDEDTVSEDLGFTNIHYYAAAATQYGHITMGGYEYAGKPYDTRFDHVAPYDTCIDCHDPHTLEVQFDECTACHTNLREADDLVDIRMEGSLVDYDGDGDLEEGMFYEIEGLRDMLYTAMQSYATEIAASPIVYNEASHPYFFIDTNADGEGSEDEINGDNRYASWTPRLAKAAYNYQVSLKDPGRYAHGGKYIVQLLYDSIESLNEAISTPVDLANANRIDAGHFAGSEIAFREWDAEGAVVPGTCSRCHSAAGLPFWMAEGVSASQPAANGLNCATCHNDVSTFTRFQLEEVTFPSGAHLSNPEQDVDSNLCLACHQGRESTVSVNRLIGETGDDEQSESLRFLNIHYFAAGATLFGTEAKGAYEYTGQEYAGRNTHIGAFDSCNECHNTHSLEVQVEQCTECHEGAGTLETLRTEIRISDVDYDGDGDVNEGIAMEIATMHEAVYAALQSYAGSTIGTDIAYSTTAYPYFFIDLNGNGEVDPDEANRDNRYVAWTPRLLRGAYNYQYVQKDPGAFAHNSVYIIQILYDTLTDLGADTSGMIRPDRVAPSE
jgi:hypothetical protein